MAYWSDPPDEEALRKLMADPRYWDEGDPDHYRLRDAVTSGWQALYPGPAQRDAAGRLITDPNAYQNMSFNDTAESDTPPPQARLTDEAVEGIRQHAMAIRPDLGRPFSEPVDAGSSTTQPDSLAYRDAWQRNWVVPQPLPLAPPAPLTDEAVEGIRQRAMARPPDLGRPFYGLPDTGPSGAQADSRAAQGLVKGIVESPRPRRVRPPAVPSSVSGDFEVAERERRSNGLKPPEPREQLHAYNSLDPYIEGDRRNYEATAGVVPGEGQTELEQLIDRWKSLTQKKALAAGIPDFERQLQAEIDKVDQKLDWLAARNAIASIARDEMIGHAVLWPFADLGPALRGAMGSIAKYIPKKGALRNLKMGYTYLDFDSLYNENKDEIERRKKAP